MLAEDKRFPRSVYGVGEEPDPRFSLANERTFLAWIRTSLGLFAVGIAVHVLSPADAGVWRTVASIVFVGLAIAAAAHGWWSWSRTERALRAGRVLPGMGVGALIVGGVVLGMLMIAAVLLL